MIRDCRLLPAAAACWLGTLVALRLGTTASAVVVLLLLAATAVAAIRLRHPPGGRHRGRTAGRAAATVVLTTAVAAAVTGWAGVRAQLRVDTVEPHLRSSVVAVLRVDGEPRSVGGGRVVVDATWTAVTTATAHPAPVGVPVVVLADEAWTSVVVGSRVQVRARVAPTETGDGAGAMLVPTGEPTLLARPPPLAAAVAGLRAGLIEACARLDPQAQGLVPGIAVGDDRALPATLEDDLRTVSLTHVTAVSGAHVAMVLGLVLALLVRLPRAVRAVAAGTVLAGLVLLVHPTPSVVRAAAMGGVLLVGLLLTRPRAALPALWTSVIVLLVVDPWLAGSFGFVLSVLATGGLLLASGPVADRFARVLPRPLALALAVPVAAQLACLPALALLQPGAPVHGVLANTLAAPAVPPATLLGLLATLVHPVHAGAAQLLASWAAVATAWIAAVATWCAALPLATVPWWVVLLVLLVLLGVVALRLGWGRTARDRAGRRCGSQVAG